jgi:G:T/U-mismatch repair DNA glycosylase
MPGQLLLERRQYYAQPRNAFWFLMGERFGVRHVAVDQPGAYARAAWIGVGMA